MKTREQAQQEADEWNERVHVGTLVLFNEQTGLTTPIECATTSYATIVHGYTAAVRLSHSKSPVPLSHCQPVLHVDQIARIRELELRNLELLDRVRQLTEALAAMIQAQRPRELQSGIARARTALTLAGQHD